MVGMLVDFVASARVMLHKDSSFPSSNMAYSLNIRQRPLAEIMEEEEGEEAIYETVAEDEGSICDNVVVRQGSAYTPRGETMSTSRASERTSIQSAIEHVREFTYDKGESLTQETPNKPDSVDERNEQAMHMDALDSAFAYFDQFAKSSNTLLNELENSFIDLEDEIARDWIKVTLRPLHQREEPIYENSPNSLAETVLIPDMARTARTNCGSIIFEMAPAPACGNYCNSSNSNCLGFINCCIFITVVMIIIGIIFIIIGVVDKKYMD